MNMQNSHSGHRYDHRNYLHHELPNYVAKETSGTALLEEPANGLNVDGLMTLFMNNQSTRQLAKEIVQFNSTAVLGALAYKAHAHWLSNDAVSEIAPVTRYDVTQASPLPCFTRQQAVPKEALLVTVLMKAMIAASKVHEGIGKDEQEQLLKAAKQLGFNTTDRRFIDELMNRDITIQEIIHPVSLSKHKSEVYLAAYLAGNENSPPENEFLERLASAMNLPNGLAQYLERQADLGIVQ